MENKRIKFFVSTKADTNDNERSVIHYATTKDIDRDNEIILPEGIELINFKSSPVVLWNHLSFSAIQTVIGKSLWQKADEKGLLCKTEFAKTQLADETYELYKGGYLTSWSIGFLPKDWVDGENIRTFTRTELLEYSAVAIPANPAAISLSFIKGIKSDELKATFVNDYLLETFDKEIKSLNSIINGYKQVSGDDIKKLIDNEVENIFKQEIKPKIDEISGELKSIKMEKAKNDLELMVEGIVKSRLAPL